MTPILCGDGLADGHNLEIEQGEGKDCSGGERGGDEPLVAHILVGDIKAGKGRKKEADRDQKKEELQRQWVVRVGER